MTVEFYLVEYDDKPDVLHIRIDGANRPATKADTKAHPEAYKALKMKMATEPPRIPFEQRRGRAAPAAEFRKGKA